jgi:hypothetical protein
MILELAALVMLICPWTPDVVTDARYPGVNAHDAIEFGVWSRWDSLAMWKAANAHIEHYNQGVLCSLPFQAYQQWITEAVRCREAWNRLDNALLFSGQARLWELNQLRAVLGEEDYRARRMPMPCPQGWEFVWR